MIDYFSGIWTDASAGIRYSIVVSPQDTSSATITQVAANASTSGAPGTSPPTRGQQIQVTFPNVASVWGTGLAGNTMSGILTSPGDTGFTWKDDRGSGDVRWTKVP